MLLLRRPDERIINIMRQDKGILVRLFEHIDVLALFFSSVT